MTKKLRKPLGIILSSAMVLSVCTIIPFTASAADEVASVTSAETTKEYADLSEALSAWTDGSTLTLLDDVTTSNTIYVKGGIKTFDLNGHNITKTGDHGSVFKVTGGNLTVNGSGNISGGKGMNDGENSSYHRGGGFHVAGSSTVVTVNNVTITNNAANWGGGVFVAGGGTFTMNNSTISNNATNYITNIANWNDGGAAFVQDNSTFIMNGGTITGNTTDDGKFCGVSIPSGSFKVSGNAVIADNKYNGTQKNVSGTVTVIGELTEGANIGITHNAGVFTNSTNTEYNDLTKFTSDSSSYVVGKNAAGQLYLDVPRTVTWKMDNGETIDTTTLANGSVPTHADAAKDDDDDTSYTFTGWTDSSDNFYAKGTDLPAATSDVTYTANFKTVPIKKTTVKYTADPVYTVVIPETVTLGNTEVTEQIKIYGADENSNVVIPRGKSVNVALTGSTNDFNVKNADDNTIAYTVNNKADIADLTSVAVCEADHKTTADITFAKTGDDVYAGTYTDTLTFTVSLADA